MSEREMKNEVYKETNILYDGDDFMVIEPLSEESVYYFTNNNTGYVKYWSEHSNDKDFLLIIDKKNTPTNFYGIENDDGKIEIRYFDGKNFNDLNEDDLLLVQRMFGITPLSSGVFEVLNPFFYDGSTYGLLMDIKNGDRPNDNLIDSSDIINKIRYNEKRPGKSMVSLEFDDAEDYFLALGVQEDSLYLIKDLFDNYYGGSDIEIISYDQTYEDFNEGYLLSTFNEENNELLKHILTYVSPELSPKLDSNIDSWNSTVSTTLNDMFEREIDWIITDATDLENGCRTKQLREDIKEDAGDRLGEYGIFMGECFSRYFTTVDILIGLYDKSGSRSQPLSSLLSELVDGEDINYDEWQFESYCSDDFNPELNKQIKVSLESIIEKIEESDEFIDIKEYSNLYTKYVGKYGFKEHHKNPISGDFFRIEGINKKNNKIIVGVGKDKPNNFQSREYDEEGFNLFLNQPELF
tara:strand:- start:1432 stop:2829 length:1398 start_codon:yes stop_codon:yes gene_type:complete